jgi:hypothetical protein
MRGKYPSKSRGEGIPQHKLPPRISITPPHSSNDRNPKIRHRCEISGIQANPCPYTWLKKTVLAETIVGPHVSQITLPITRNGKQMANTKTEKKFDKRPRFTSIQYINTSVIDM